MKSEVGDIVLRPRDARLLLAQRVPGFGECIDSLPVWQCVSGTQAGFFFGFVC